MPSELDPGDLVFGGGEGHLWATNPLQPYIGRFVPGGTTIGTGPCLPSDHVLCLDDQPGDRRFRVEVEYNSSRNGGISGAGHALALDTLGVHRGGLFWFFSQDNPEIDLALTIMVEDVVTGEVHTYYNLDRQPFAPVQDVNAIDCTP